MAEATFNRELGTNPAGITRFGQIRTEDGSNVTIATGYRTFAADGKYSIADVYEITYGATGTFTVILSAGTVGVKGVRVIGSDGAVDGSVEAPKRTRRSTSGVAFSVTSGDTATIYVDRSDRSHTEYQLLAGVV